MPRLFFIVFLCCFVSCSLLDTKPSETVIYTAPSSGATSMDLADAAYLRIRILPAGYEVSLLDKFLKTDYLNAVDSFISINKALIDSSKVILVSSNDSLASFQKIRPILMKYNIDRAAISIK